MMEMGLTPGTKIERLQGKDPIIVRFRKGRVMMRLEEADLIFVESEIK